MCLCGSGNVHAVRVRIALLLQHATGMPHILSSLFWPLHHVFSTLFNKWHDFREKGTEHKVCALIFSTTLSKTFLILT
jgi:hypothetical protein